jgi:hypothetical protein
VDTVEELVASPARGLHAPEKALQDLLRTQAA